MSAIDRKYTREFSHSSGFRGGPMDLRWCGQLKPRFPVSTRRLADVTSPDQCENNFNNIKGSPITASATLCPFSLADCLSRRTEKSRRYLHGFQDRGKHGAGLLPEKPFRRGGAVRAREEEVVHRCQARTLSGMVKSSQLMVPQ